MDDSTADPDAGRPGGRETPGEAAKPGKAPKADVGKAGNGKPFLSSMAMPGLQVEEEILIV